MKRKTDNKLFLAYVPKNAPDLDELCRSKPLADAVRLVYHQLYRSKLKYWRRSSDKHPEGFDEGWVPLCTETLRKIIYKDHIRKVITFMQTNNLLEVYAGANGQQSYKPGRCKMYRIPGHLYQKVAKGHLYRKEKITSKGLVRKLNYMSDRSGDLQEWPIKYESTTKMIEMAKQLIPRKDLLGNELLNEIDSGMLELLVDLQNEFEDGVFKIDDYGHRFYSHVTNLRSTLRKLYRFCGHGDEQHSIIDVCNSQPYLLGVILLHHNVIRRYLPEFKKLIPLLFDFKHEQDVQEYFMLVQTGQFYELWFDHFETVNSEDRKRLKKLLFAGVYYGKTKGNPYADDYAEMKMYRDFFIQKFPNVFKAISIIKTVDVSEYPELKPHLYSRRTGRFLGQGASYKLLPMLMQRLESKFFVDKIASRLIKLRITPFTTIHDSYWVPKSKEQQVVRQIELFFKRHGIAAPKLKVDDV